MGEETVRVFFVTYVERGTCADLGVRQCYRETKDQWWGVAEVFDRQDTIEAGYFRFYQSQMIVSLLFGTGSSQERHRIDVDCRRTDRNQSLFAAMDEDDENDEKGMHMRYSTISPQLSDIGAQAPTNEHIERLGGILLTYNFYEKELGQFIYSPLHLECLVVLY